jgi:Flp pilus assembly protein CpaB
MSRRGRALAFLAGALVCAGLAAAIAGGYERSVSEQLGALRPVVVAESRLPANRAIEPREAERGLTVRRVPERFAPPGALTSPAEAVGLEPAADLAPGAYLLAGQLAPPKRPGRGGPRVSRGLSPIEIEVTGAGALAASSGGAHPGRVDVVVTSEPGPGGRGRTYVAAEAVELLALAEGGAGSPEDDPLATAGAPPVYTATLAVARAQALKLIQAENFARQVRLIPSG